MSEFFGPLDSDGRVPPASADARRRVPDLRPWRAGAAVRVRPPLQLESAWQTELNAQLYREAEIVSLLHARDLMGAGSRAWAIMAASWETAWLPTPVEGIADRTLALAVDLAALAHAVHAGIRPAALLPVEVDANDPFAMALRRIEFESGRLLQAQIILLKGPNLLPFRDAVSAALERRHVEVRKLWAEAARRRRHRQSTIGIMNEP